MNDELKTASDFVRDPSSISWGTYAWVVALAIWGGIVRVFREVTLGDKSWRQILAVFIGETLTSGFAGVLVFFVCESQSVPRLYAAALTGIAGYMGGRALTMLEAIIKARSLPKGE